MTTRPNLEDLEQKQKDLLLAEVAALLHDMGKFCILHVEAHSDGGIRRWSNNHAYKVVVDDPVQVIQLSPQSANLRKPEALRNVLNARSPKFADFLPSNAKTLLAQTRISLPSQQYALSELIMLGTPGFATSPHRPQLLNGKDGWLPAVLGVCHNEAHVDKQDPSKESQQKWPKIYISSAFGFEDESTIVDVNTESANNLDQRLRRLPWTHLFSLKHKLSEEFSYGFGDTRHPINEVTLADWAEIVAALYKSALATWVLESIPRGIRGWKSWRDKVIDHDLRWRILRVNFDALRLYTKAVRIGDLVGYRQAVGDAFEAVKRLVEEEYPLGNEIYRDTTGIYFTFPDINLPPELEQEIRRRIEAVDKEFAPKIAVEIGQGNTAKEQLKTLLTKAREQAQKDLAYPFRSETLDLRYWQQAWNRPNDICPVCRLRPVQENAETCRVCGKRRARRLKTWLDNPSTTIWTNEIADANGRLALIVGRFDLDDWLSGDLVQSLMVKADPDKPDFQPKNPSPARLRRIWETTQQFWKTALNPQDTPLLPSVPERLVLRGKLSLTALGRENFEDNAPQTYDLHVAGRTLSVVWNGKDGFILCDNPAYFKKVTDKNLEEILVPDASFELFTSVGYKQKRQTLGQLTLASIAQAPANYRPVIPILEDPIHFLALVPADRALTIVRSIREKYEREMGKVRDRLPLHLSLVFADRRTPLPAILEAGRAMLVRSSDESQWTVSQVNHRNPANRKGLENWPEAVSLTLEKDGHPLDFQIPTLMGDGATPDRWYPYWQVPAESVGRRWCYTGENHRHWLHVCDLQAGDAVILRPSTFDFEFLDTTARRYEITYDAQGRRPRRTRPYYLEDLHRLDELWKTLNRLTKTQRVQVVHDIETARERWFGRDTDYASAQDEVFRAFVADTLAKANWPEKPANMDALITAGQRGELADLLELHHHILKED